jgi:hypothetical protein
MSNNLFLFIVSYLISIWISCNYPKRISLFFYIIASSLKLSFLALKIWFFCSYSYFYIILGICKIVLRVYLDLLYSLFTITLLMSISWLFVIRALGLNMFSRILKFKLERGFFVIPSSWCLITEELLYILLISSVFFYISMMGLLLLKFSYKFINFLTLFWRLYIFFEIYLLSRILPLHYFFSWKLLKTLT